MSEYKMGKEKSKEVKFLLDEIPINGCIIKEDYFICKDEKGNIKVGKVSTPLSPAELKTLTESKSSAE